MTTEGKLTIFKDNAVTALFLGLKDLNEAWEFEALIDEIAANNDNLLRVDWQYGSERPELDPRKTADGENAIALHKYLGSMSPVELSDNRLWTYLSTVEFRDYTSRRWPLEGGKDIGPRAMSRWLMRQASLNSISRSAISRLWFAAERFHDPDMQRPLSAKWEDPYAYVTFLFANQDRYQQMFERETLLHRELAFVMLDHMASGPGRDTGQYAKDLTLHVLAASGYRELELLSNDELRELVGEIGDFIAREHEVRSEKSLAGAVI